MGAAAGRSSVSLADKKITPISTDRGNHQDWLPFTTEFRTFCALGETEELYTKLATVEQY